MRAMPSRRGACEASQRLRRDPREKGGGFPAGGVPRLRADHHMITPAGDRPTSRDASRAAPAHHIPATHRRHQNVSGAGGIIGSNQLGEAAPNGETIGFFTLDVIAQLVANPSLRTNYSGIRDDRGLRVSAGLRMPARIRRPASKVATDIMKARDFKVLSLNLQNSNTVNQSLSSRSPGHQVSGGAGLSRIEGGRNRDLAEYRPVREHLVAGLAWVGRADHGGSCPAAMADRCSRKRRRLSAQPRHARPADLRGVLRIRPPQEAVRVSLRGAANQQRPAGCDVQDSAAASQLARRDHRRDAISLHRPRHRTKTSSATIRPR